MSSLENMYQSTVWRAENIALFICTYSVLLGEKRKFHFFSFKISVFELKIGFQIPNRKTKLSYRNKIHSN